MWLLEALDTLSKQNPIATDVQAVKEQFQEHEVECDLLIIYINHYLFRTLGTCHVHTYCQLTFKINSEEEKRY